MKVTYHRTRNWKTTFETIETADFWRDVAYAVHRWRMETRSSPSAVLVEYALGQALYGSGEPMAGKMILFGYFVEPGEEPLPVVGVPFLATSRFLIV